MISYMDFEKKYTTNEIREEESRLITEGIESKVKLPHRVKRIELGELIKEYTLLLQSKPKRFYFGVIPNGYYNFQMVDWTFLEKKMRSLLNSSGIIEWTY